MLAFYGDDFTGSTDAMEALALSGLRTVLFLETPTTEQLSGPFADVRCIGVAGSSRAMSPAEMDADLAPILQDLWTVGAPVLHYKVCSTFDSSPTVGSIGHVIDSARASLTAGSHVSIVPGSPPLRRYTVFGTHFASAGDQVFRLDRHPTMLRHPVTPMDEADLRLHLSRQTETPIASMTIEDLAGAADDVAAFLAERLRTDPGAVLYDTVNDDHLRAVGRLLWDQGQRARHFVVGSSGVEYALTAHWRDIGLVTEAAAAMDAIDPVDQLLVVSGSASPATARQIEWAEKHGFACLRAPAADFADPGNAGAAFQSCLDEASNALSGGNSVLIYTALGPDDPSIAAARTQYGGGEGALAKVLGANLGRLAKELIARGQLRRLVIAGGDTSSFAVRELGLFGLEMRAELTRGAPLCRGYSEDPAFDGLEVALKGGQMGGVDYFGQARGG